MNWLRKFMIGRYGQDHLSLFLLILSMIITLIGHFSGITILITISYVPLVVAFYRMFSKDIQKRRMENYKFAMLLSPIYGKMNVFKNRLQQSKTHKHFKCSGCNTVLRVPKNKGKILVTCPKCKLKFTRKT